MAAAAKPGPDNHIDTEVLQDYLDRFEELEDAALKIMMDAMAACKNGPRKEQKQLREEMKQRGVRRASFSALWGVRDAERKAEKKIGALEDDDLDQLKEFASAMADTPFGEFIKARLDAQ